MEYENQSLILGNTQEKLKQSKEQLNVHVKTETNEESNRAVNKTIRDLNLEKKELLSSKASLEAQIEAFKEDNANLTATVKELKKTLEETTTGATKISNERNTLKSQLAAMKTEMRGVTEAKTKAENELLMLTMKVASYTEKIERLEHEHSQFTEIRDQRDSLLEKNDGLRQQVMVIARDSTKRMHELQNQLQATRQFLEVAHGHLTSIYPIVNASMRVLLYHERWRSFRVCMNV